MTKRSALALLLLLFVVSDLTAENLSGFRKVLIPSFTGFPVKGVGGTSFATEVNFFSPGRCIYFPASAIVGHYGFDTIGPGLGSFAVEGGAKLSPRFVYVYAQCYDQAKFSETIITPAGRVQLPLLREEQFLTGTTQLLGIPIVLRGGDCFVDCSAIFPVYRHKVRVINEDDDANGAVLVRLWLPWHDASVTAPDAEYHVALDRRAGTDPSYPYYGEVDVESPCLRERHGCVEAIGRIEVVPVSPALRYWAFATSTHNETQQIELSLPQ